MDFGNFGTGQRRMHVLWVTLCTEARGIRLGKIPDSGIVRILISRVTTSSTNEIHRRWYLRDLGRSDILLAWHLRLESFLQSRGNSSIFGLPHFAFFLFLFFFFYLILK